MNILVCIKQVADSESPFTVADDGSRLEFGPRVAYRINLYDEYALEEALLIAERNPGTKIDAVSIGPDRVKDAVRRALSMGAAEGFHIPDDHPGNPSPLLKARLIADFARQRGYDLILAGVMSEDFGNCSVGPMTAELLGIPCATHVMSLACDMDARKLNVEREIDSTTRHALTLALPALVTVQSGINRPRYPSLTNVLRAKSQEIPSLPAAGLPDAVSSGERRSLVVPPETRRGTVLRADRDAMAAELWRYLHSKSLI
ncbi:MAG: electron transfer flavoprotein subunit beta/FixA family protein [Spirochaetes bacterium]|nr:electron transfer flavoprotein subunit beta/FixA family protein [Spirochaetota bacterium]